MVVEIHDGSPTGTLLATTSLSAGAFPSNPNTNTFAAFTFSTPATIVNGNVYAIVVTTSATTFSSNIYTIASYSEGVVTGTDYYPRGEDYSNTGSGWTAVGGSPNPASLDFKTFVQLPTPTVGVNCIPSTVNVGGSSSCTATVSGATGSIAGETITWSQVGGTGTATFPSGNECNLVTTSCSITVVGDPGNIILQASYPGDSSNAASAGTFTLTVNSAAPIPEYPYGLAILAVLMLLAYAVIKHRARNPKDV